MKPDRPAVDDCIGGQRWRAARLCARRPTITRRSRQPTSPRVIKPQFSPYAGRSFPTRPLFGDTHLHTAVSVDAGTLNRLGQEEAFRFARGEEVTSTGGLRAKLSRPLDFLVISDHAEMYGLMPQLLAATRRCWPPRRAAMV